jgi:hypothetical protein
MIDQTLRHAVERQEQLRREAATGRRFRRTPGRSSRIAASVAAILRNVLVNPIPSGNILPATH